MFYLRTAYGSLDPHEEFLFDMFFEPIKATEVEWLLTIKVDDNREIFKVKLKGEGMMPELIINEMQLEFDPALPYTSTSTKLLKLENPCTFPVELFFPEFDE